MFVNIVTVSNPSFLCVLACGGHTNGTNGTITSPNFGNYTLNYPLNTKCVWTITVPTNMTIEIVGTYINTEYDYDFIVVSFIVFSLCIFR